MRHTHRVPCSAVFAGSEPIIVPAEYPVHVIVAVCSLTDSCNLNEIMRQMCLEQHTYVGALGGKDALTFDRVTLFHQNIRRL